MSDSVAEAAATGQVKSASIHAVVLKCTCGHPETHFGLVCPQAVAIPQGVDGLVAHYNADPALQKEFDDALAKVEGRPVRRSSMWFSRGPIARMQTRVISTLLKWRNKL